ncbi:MAG TPA: DNA polymerase III subunit gamma/tau [Candidatus Paceibacterota bacterium]|nr:DNA polymerase III subunit gamma/tau [Candidatus Paceibacterota bacterium]
MSGIQLALYRKYRPTSFDEVRNQEHVISVLKGAIEKKQVPHALLFTGPRGTGKTTVARIFAKAVGASDVDTYEIDAASNRSIDDVRELKEAVSTLPYESPYKVYIVDEVHMLTKEAFNALLKTLEEPPAHVIFILATTERDKLLDTITSRCQVFEFHAPTREELRETVIAVAKREKFKLAPHVADVIALSADGSYRDALGITQKVMLASGDRELGEDEVARIVGAPRSAVLSEVVAALASKDADRGLRALSEAETAHVDMKFFLKLLLERLRAVVLLRNTKDKDALLSRFGDEEGKTLLSYANDAKSPINSHLLLRAIELGGYVGKSFAPTLPIELLLIEQHA